ncbi:MAG: zinc ABC transporter substrate-binding protein [Deltaproteobacteria bacterium]|nr:zinc ABC transporter substrate-binding protein [Deltaproteobacteria bacterium]
MNRCQHKIIYYCLIIFTAITLSNRLNADEKPSKPIPVFVSIQPQAYFVKRIGGDRVTIDVLLPAGKNPATYAPTPAKMSKLAKTRVYFRIGVPFENFFISKIASSSQQIQIVDTRTGIKLRKMAGRNHRQEGGNDPHIWMSPVLVKIQAKTIYKTLVLLDPEGRVEYAKGLNSFLHDLDELHKKISRSLATVKGKTIFVFHPSFGYFADTYGIKQLAVEMEGKAPKGKNLSIFIKKAKKERVHVIFVQPEFDPNAASKIAGAINGVVVSIDPLAMDYIKNLEDMADKVYEALKSR